MVKPQEVTNMNDAPAPRDEATEPDALDLESLEGVAGGAGQEGLFNPLLNISFN
jgi:hypothetical protein